MPSFTSDKFSNFYKRILQIGNSDNSGTPTSTTSIQAGDGTSTCASISDDQLHIQPQTDNTTTAVQVAKSGGGAIFQIDTTNDLVKGGVQRLPLNTNYAVFSIDATMGTSYGAGNHYPLIYGGGNYPDKSNPPSFGTSADPATSFTTADANTDRASDIANVMWYVQDAITIDAVVGIEGADAATGDSTNMHLFSYDFTSGATNCLTNGTLLAHNSTVTNAGSEQPYLTSFTIDSADVALGKVIVAFFEPVSINSDYTISMQIKYHLQ